MSVSVRATLLPPSFADEILVARDRAIDYDRV